MAEEYDRQQMLSEIWTDPLRKVAPRYGLSDAGLKKLCSRLQLPTPGRGYWAKIKAGHSIPPKPKLRPFTGNPRHLLKTTALHPTRSAKPELVDDRLTALIAYERDSAHRISVPMRGTRWNPLVAATRDAFQAAHENNQGLPLPRDKGLDIAVSTEQRSRALHIANALVRALEQRGFEMVQGHRHLEVLMFGVHLSLSIQEPTSRANYVPSDAERAAAARGGWSYWPRYRYTPSGRLQIRSDSGFGGTIRDGVHQRVEDQLNKLIIQMATRAIAVLHRREEWARAEELRQTQRREALAQKARQDKERQRLEELKATALRWQQAQTIRAYLMALEQTASRDVGALNELYAYLDWARAKADWLDPLVAAPDPILDQVILIPA